MKLILFEVLMWKRNYQLKKNKITIIPNVENKFFQEDRESFLDYISSNTTLFIQNTDALLSKLDSLFAKAKEAYSKLSGTVKHLAPEQLFLNQKHF